MTDQRELDDWILMPTWDGLKRLRVPAPDEDAMRLAQSHWDHVAMPLDGLGRFEQQYVRIAGIERTADVSLDAPLLVVMCADNGIVREGVSQSGQEVTAAVAGNIARGTSSAGRFAEHVGCKIRVVDVGCASYRAPAGAIDARVMSGTRDFLMEPAMTCEECISAVAAGVREARRASQAGHRILAAGEMGIGNTTTSTACAAALLHLDPEKVTGRGAGLDREGLSRKKQVIREAIEKYDLLHKDAEEILCCVGGLDIAALAGLIIGASFVKTPVILDGLITCVGALIAERILPGSSACCIASHIGREPAVRRVMKALGLGGVIDGDMALGEGTGALMMLSLLQMTGDVYRTSSSFDGIGVEQYQRKS